MMKLASSAMLTQALLSQGKVEEAKKEIEAAKALLMQSQHLAREYLASEWQILFGIFMPACSQAGLADGSTDYAIFFAIPPLRFSPFIFREVQCKSNAGADLCYLRSPC